MQILLETRCKREISSQLRSWNRQDMSSWKLLWCWIFMCTCMSIGMPSSSWKFLGGLLWWGLLLLLSLMFENVVNIGQLKDKTFDKYLNKLITFTSTRSRYITNWIGMKVQILILTSLLLAFHARAMETEVIVFCE